MVDDGEAAVVLSLVVTTVSVVIVSCLVVEGRLGVITGDPVVGDGISVSTRRFINKLNLIDKVAKISSL